MRQRVHLSLSVGQPAAPPFGCLFGGPLCADVDLQVEEATLPEPLQIAASANLDRTARTAHVSSGPFVKLEANLERSKRSKTSSDEKAVGEATTRCGGKFCHSLGRAL